mmetsp:Transcript_14929/g.40020  ORF Transcript_14929/g.40020 Transcript_14929/m.40020 type:complete len:1848 (-) Transcript_14929:135-5678(-)
MLDMLVKNERTQLQAEQRLNKQLRKQLEESCKELQDDAESKQQKLKAMFEGLLEERVSECRELRGRLLSLEVDLGARSKRLEEAEHQLLDARTQLSDLAVEHFKSQSVEKAAVEVATKAESELIAKGEELSQSRSKAAALERAVHERDETLKDLQESKASCERESATMKRALAEINNAVTSSSREKAQLEQMLSDKVREIKALSEANQDAEHIIANLSESISKANVREQTLLLREEQLRSDLGSLQKELSDMTANTSKLDAREKALKDREKLMFDKCSAMKNEVSAMQAELAQAQEREKSARTEVLNVRRENVDLHANLLAARRQNVDARTLSALRAKSAEADAARRMCDALSSKLAVYEKAIMTIYGKDEGSQSASGGGGLVLSRNVRENLWRSAVASYERNSGASKVQQPAANSRDRITIDELTRDFNRAERAFASARSTHTQLASAFANDSLPVGSRFAALGTSGRTTDTQNTTDTARDEGLDEDARSTLAGISNDAELRVTLRADLEAARCETSNLQNVLEEREERLAFVSEQLHTQRQERIEIEGKLELALFGLESCRLELDAKSRASVQGTLQDEELLVQKALSRAEKIAADELKKLNTEIARMGSKQPNTKEKPTVSASGSTSLDFEVLKLRDEVKSATEVSEKRAQELRELRSELEDRERAVHTQREALGEGRTKYQNLSQELERTKSALENEERKSLHLQQNLNASKASCEKLEKSLELKSIECDDGVRKLNEARKEIQSGLGSIEKLERELKSTGESLAACEKQLVGTQQELKECQKRLEDEQKAHADSEARCAEARDEIARLEGELADAHATIEAHERREDELRDSISRQQAALYELHDRLKSQESGAAEKEVLVERLRGELNDLERALSAANAQGAALEKACAAAKKELAGLRMEVVECNEKLIAKDAELVRAHSTVKDMEATVTTGTSVETLKERVITEHTTLARKLSLKQTERIDQLSATVKAKDVYIGELSKKLDAVKHQAEVQASDIKILREELEALENSLSETEQDLRNSQNEVSTVRREKEQVEGELAETQTELRKTALALETTQASLDETRDSYSSLMGDMQELNAHAKEWHRDLTTAKESLKDCSDEISAKKELITEKERTIAGLKEDVMRCTSQANALKQDIKRLEDELATSKAETADRVQQLKERKQSISELEQQLSACRRQLTESDEMLKEVESQRNAKEQHVKQLLSARESLDNDLAHNKRRLLETETRLIELETEHALVMKREQENRIGAKGGAKHRGAKAQSPGQPSTGQGASGDRSSTAGTLAYSSESSASTVPDLSAIWRKKIEGVEELEKSILKRDAEISRLVSKNTELQSTLKVRTASLAQSKQRLEAVEAEIRQLDSKIQSDVAGELLKIGDKGSARVNQWAACIDAKLRHSETLVSEKETLVRTQETRIRELEQNVAALQHDGDIQKEQHVKQETRLNGALVELSERLDKVQSDAEAEKLHLDAELLAVREEKEELAIMNEKIRAELETSREQMSALESTVLLAEDEKARLGAKIMVLEAELADARLQLSSVSTHPAVLSSQDSHATSGVKTMRESSKTPQAVAAAGAKGAEQSGASSSSMSDLQVRVKTLETELAAARTELDAAKKTILELEPEAQRSRLANRAMGEMTRKLHAMEKDMLQRLTKSEAELRIRAQQIRLLEEECAKARANYITMRDRVLRGERLAKSDAQESGDASSAKSGELSSPKSVVESELKSASGVGVRARDSFVSVRFILAKVGAFIQRREVLHLVGSDSVLGAWNLAASPALSAVRTLDSGELALCVEILLPRASPRVEYKYVIELSNGAFVWENGGNRVLELGSAPPTLEVYDSWHS